MPKDRLEDLLLRMRVKEGAVHAILQAFKPE